MEGLFGWRMNSMPGSPPSNTTHERRYTPFTHPFMLTRWIWKQDYDGQMIFGDLVGLKLPDICLTYEEKPRKTSPRKLVPTRIEPGPKKPHPGNLSRRGLDPGPKNLTQETCPDEDWTRARCVTDAHATACSTAVDYLWYKEPNSSYNIFLI